MSQAFKAILPLLLLGAFILFRFKAFFQRTIRRILLSPLHELPGPKSANLLWGNFKEIVRAVSPAAG
jgi:hypothetical protein